MRFELHGDQFAGTIATCACCTKRGVQKVHCCVFDRLGYCGFPSLYDDTLARHCVFVAVSQSGHHRFWGCKVVRLYGDPECRRSLSKIMRQCSVTITNLS